MRLGQLARKINVNATDIVNYLNKDLGVKMNSNLNSKIDDQYLDQLLAHFVPEKAHVEEIKVIHEAKETPELKEKKEVSVVKEVADQENEIESKKDSIEIDEESEIETIKAKAQRLEGLKVIGKIDLPPPPPPEMIEIDGVMYDKKEIQKQRKEERKKQKSKTLKGRETNQNNPEVKNRVHPTLSKRNLSFEEKRVQEEKDYTKRKKAKEKFQKERQRKHYEKIKNSKVIVKTDKKKKAKVEKADTIEKPIEVKAKPKSLLGKFWRWLNT